MNASTPSASRKILIIDDLPSNIDLLGEIFETEGYEILVATDGASGGDTARRAAPDLILLDVLLPGTNGFETCRMLKRDPSTADIPVMFITAKDDSESRLEGFQAGGVDYITRPFQREEVLARARAHLTISRLSKELRQKNADLAAQIDQCKLAEETVRRVNVSLEKRVAERTAELEAVNRLLEIDIAERKRVEETLREFPRRIIAAQEAERKRVAQELHDSVTQLVSSANHRINWLLKDSGTRHKPTLDVATTVSDLLRMSIEELRRVCQNLRPPELDDLGLPAAARSICRAVTAWSGLEIDLDFSRVPNHLPAPVALNLYRIIQESLNNVHKHAQATHVNVHLSWHDSFLQLTVKDNGRGFDPAAGGATRNPLEGFGLISMRERAACLQGTFEIRSALAQGTEIVVRLPFDSAGQ